MLLLFSTQSYQWFVVFFTHIMTSFCGTKCWSRICTLFTVLSSGSERLEDRVLRGFWKQYSLSRGVWRILQATSTLDCIHDSQSDAPNQRMGYHCPAQPITIHPLYDLPGSSTVLYIDWSQHSHHGCWRYDIFSVVDLRAVADKRAHFTPPTKLSTTPDSMQ